MQSTSSVAEGSFLFKPNGFTLSKLKRNKRKRDESVDELWEKSFNTIWTATEKEIKDINQELFSKVLEDLISHLKKLHTEITLSEGVLPCEILLTGTNLPDHKLLLSTLCANIKEHITPHVATLWSQDCPNIKIIIRELVEQILPPAPTKNNDSEDEDDLGLNESIDAQAAHLKLQSGQYTLATLSAWYNDPVKDSDARKSVIIILPDFESFSSKVLNDFILLLSSYSGRIPLILVFGVATTPSAVHQNLPRAALSQVVLQQFHSEPSTTFLNHVIEKVFFSERFPFRLGSKCMTFLTDIFLFHSFSVQGFIQGLKFCMMDHFYKRNHMSLCCPPDDLEGQAALLGETDLENIRKLPSFQRLVEAKEKEERRLLLLDAEHTKKTVIQLLKDVHEYTNNFHVVLKGLYILTSDLPQMPLGRHVREYYCKAVSTELRALPEYQETLSLLRLLSRTELNAKLLSLLDLLKISSILDILSLDTSTKLDDVVSKLEGFKAQLAAIEAAKENEAPNFELLRKTLVDYLDSELVGKLLSPPTSLPLHEILYFDDLPSVRRRISGAPRSAVHTALNNPHYYLECECCVLPEPSAVLSTLPDLAIAYKLHLECNKIINLYDWLQAFAATVKPDKSTDDGEVDQEVQARFTRALSELQFLGFIKPSRAKTDHVSRLTWGNS